MDTTIQNAYQPSQLIQQQTAQLWTVVRQTGSTIESLLTTINELQSKNCQLDEHLATLQSEFSQLREENIALSEQAAHTHELREAFAKANTTIATLTSNLHDRDSEIARIAKELQQLEELRALNHSLQTKLNSLSGELELNANDKELLNFATEENSALTKKLEELNEKYIASLAEFTRLEHSHSESEKMIATLQQAIGALELVLHEERATKSELVRDAEELRTLRVSTAGLQDYADRQANAAKEYESQLQEMTEKLFLAEKQNTLYQSSIADLEQALSSQQYEELFRERELQLQQEIDQQKNRISELEKQLSSTSMLSSEYEHLNEQLLYATDSYNTTKQLIHERDASLIELQKQYKESLQEIEQLRTQVHHLESVEKRLDENELIIQNLRRDLELSETSFFQQQASLSQFTDEIVTLRKHIAEGAKEAQQPEDNSSDNNESVLNRRKN